MDKVGKTKKMTIDSLAIMVAKGFENIATDMEEVKKDISVLKKDMSEVKENVKDIKKNILNLGDRFVSYHSFDSLSARVKVLEEKKK